MLEDTLKIVQFQLPAMDRVTNHQIRLPSTPSNLALNGSRDGIFTESAQQSLSEENNSIYVQRLSCHISLYGATLLCSFMCVAINWHAAINEDLCSCKGKEGSDFQYISNHLQSYKV